MSAIVWLVAVLCFVGLILNVDNGKLLSYFERGSRERRTSSNTRRNIRIENRAVGSVNRITKIIPLSNDEYQLKLLTVTPPFEKSSLNVTRSQLKHDPFQTLLTGKVTYWIADRDLGSSQPNSRYTDGDFGSLRAISPVPMHPGAIDTIPDHPVYSAQELGKILDEKDRKIAQLESQIATEQANKQKDVMDSLLRVKELNSSRNPGIPKRTQ